METARGVITSAQEGRFMLAAEDGRMRLVLLAPGAGYEAQDLADLVRRGCPISVRLRASSGRMAQVAESITEL